MTIFPLAVQAAAPAGPAQILKLDARKTIFEDGCSTHQVYEIISGIVMTYKVLADGRRQILELLRPGDFLGFSHAESYGHAAQTLSKCILRRYSQRSFLAATSNQVRLLNYLIGRRDTHYAHALLLGRRSASERVSLFFAEFGGTGEAGEEVHISLREMSDYLGLRAETVSRRVAQLCKAGLIMRSRWGTYRVLHKKKLLALAECGPVEAAGDE